MKRCFHLLIAALFYSGFNTKPENGGNKVLNEVCLDLTYCADAYLDGKYWEFIFPFADYDDLNVFVCAFKKYHILNESFFHLKYGILNEKKSFCK